MEWVKWIICSLEHGISESLCELWKEEYRPNDLVWKCRAEKGLWHMPPCSSWIECESGSRDYLFYISQNEQYFSLCFTCTIVIGSKFWFRLYSIQSWGESWRKQNIKPCNVVCRTKFFLCDKEISNWTTVCSRVLNMIPKNSELIKESKLISN